MFSELVKSTRSIRNFDCTARIDEAELVELIELCRFTPSTANRQPLKFAFVCSNAACEKVYSLLGWAGYLTDKPPYDGNVPSAYILVCVDTSIMKEAEVDVGICSQTVVLGAREKGLGACMLGNFKKKEMCELFNLPESIVPRLVIALGKPKETVEIIDSVGGEIKYYRECKAKNIVPKRTLDEILLPGVKQK